MLEHLQNWHMVQAFVRRACLRFQVWSRCFKNLCLPRSKWGWVQAGVGTTPLSNPPKACGVLVAYSRPDEKLGVAFMPYLH